MTDKQHSTDKQHPRRGIYILPNLFTTAALFAGFYAIVQAMNNQFDQAPVAIFIAMILDGLDGRVARWTHTESDFGAEYDSLSDMISFGLAPALVVYEWALSGLGKVGWLVAFLYTAAAALRLARFNTQVGTSNGNYFQGLPSPSAAALVVGLVWLLDSQGVPGREVSILALVFTLFAAGVMVSNIRYYSFKHLDLKGKVPFIVVPALALVLALIALRPHEMIFGIFLVYGLSGPLFAGCGWWRRRAAKRRAPTNTGPNRL